MLNELKKIGTFLVTEITTELARKDKKASGKLLKSFKSDVQGTSNGYELFVVAESYFKFIDKGVNGTKRNVGSEYSFKNKKPPLEPLIQWVQQRSIASGDREIRNAAFAIQTHVWKNGIKGINILESILKNVVDNQLVTIQNAYINQISIKIDSILKNGNNNRFSTK